MKHDYCIKIGGSLMKDIARLDKFLQKLTSIFGSSFLVVVGSGYLGEAYKKWLYDTYTIEIPYKFSTLNWSMIQLINASILSSLNNHYIIASSTDEVERVLDDGKCAIINSVAFSEELSLLELNTSDLKAAYLCQKFQCKELVVFTDVDGIYTSDPKTSITAKKIQSISPKDLGFLGKTSLDIGIENLLISYHLKCFVCGIDEFLEKKVISINDLKKCGTCIMEDSTHEC